MKKLLSFVVGVGVGAGAMYALDPQSGRRRRAYAVQKLGHGVRVLDHGVRRLSHDVENRSRGLLAELRARLGHEPLTDEQLRERVRAKLGRVCSHPGDVVVIARRGVVELHGHVAEQEHAAVVRAARRVRGVKSVADALVTDGPGVTPFVRGGRTRLPS